MTRRLGTTMVEVLSAVTISSIVLTSLGVVLNQTLHQYDATQRSVNLQRSVARASRTFRSDVHDSAQATFDGARLKLVEAAAETTYEWFEHRLVRTRTSDDRTHRDEFVFPACCRGQFVAATGDASNEKQPFIKLLIQLRDPSLQQNDPLPGTTKPQTIRIEALVGRNDHLPGTDP